MSKKPAPVVREIIPRLTCGADELKALAEAVESWHAGAELGHLELTPRAGRGM